MGNFWEMHFNIKTILTSLPILLCRFFLHNYFVQGIQILPVVLLNSISINSWKTKNFNTHWNFLISKLKWWYFESGIKTWKKLKQSWKDSFIKGSNVIKFQNWRKFQSSSTIFEELSPQHIRGSINILNKSAMLNMTWINWFILWSPIFYINSILFYFWTILLDLILR